MRRLLLLEPSPSRAGMHGDGMRSASQRRRRKPCRWPATVALIAVLAVMRGRATGVCARRTLPLVPAVFLLVAYAFSHLLTPPIVRCAIAVMAVLWCGYVAATDERPPIAFWGLAALSLPVLPSLQFTLGFPMRVASAAMTVGLLRLRGWPSNGKAHYSRSTAAACSSMHPAAALRCCGWRCWRR